MDVISIFAVIISFVALGSSLWLSYFKGPDVDFVEIPKGVLEKVSPITFNLFSIPRSIEASPLEIVIGNSGPRAGAFRLHITFDKSEDFEMFFDNVTCRLTFQKNPYNVTNLPGDARQARFATDLIPIGEKESVVMILKIGVDFHHWKSHFYHDPVGMDEIKSVICDADKVNKQHFSTFCSRLVQGAYLGTLTLSSDMTGQRFMKTPRVWRTWQLSWVSKELTTQNCCEITKEVVEGFRMCLDNWRGIEPSKILRQTEVIDDFLKELHKSLISLNLDRGFGNTENLGESLGKLDQIDAEFERTDLKSLYQFVMKSASGLDFRIRKFVTDIRPLGEHHRRFKMVHPEDQAKMIQSMAPVVLDLNERRTTLIEDIEKLRGILQECKKHVDLA